jgi:hypothetical protein
VHGVRKAGLRWNLLILGGAGIVVSVQQSVGVDLYLNGISRLKKI